MVDSNDKTVEVGGEGSGRILPFLYTLREIEGLSFGVLRRNFSDRINVTPDWVLPKLGRANSLDELTTKSRLREPRWDVLLPLGAPDMLYTPDVLCRQFEVEATELQKDLVIHCKLRITGSNPLHRWWEAARDFAWSVFVSSERLATIMVQHNPAATGYHDAAEPHIHVMVLTRRLGARGFEQTTELARDAAHQSLAQAWSATRRKWALTP